MEQARHLFLLLFLCLLLAPSVAQVHTLQLQPGPECGKDAIIWYLRSPSNRFGNVAEKNIPNTNYLCIAEWTWEFNPGRRWVLLDFLSEVELPNDLEIVSARLSLYSPNEPTPDDFHSSYAVRRKHPIGVVQRVLEPWNEKTVTWNNRPAASRVDQVVLPIPTDVRQDFVNIDVTALVRTMVASPGQNNGFLIRMQNEDYYRKLIFASSDYNDPALRPKLEIDYRGKKLDLDIPADCKAFVDCQPQFLPFFDSAGRLTDDTFYPEIPEECDFVQYHFRVYDATGRALFYTQKPGVGWDGTFKGHTQAAGQYSYICSYQIRGEELKTQCGQFDLLAPRP